MSISNFSSLFELFCAFNLAFVLTDQLSEDNYISIITNKILRKFNRTTYILQNIENQINISQVSLINLSDFIKGKPTLIEEQKNHLNTLDDISKSFNSNRKYIEEEINDSYKTTSFVYICLYLTFYCLFVLFISGIKQCINPTSEFCNFDRILLIFNFISIGLLAIGWIVDRKKIRESDTFRQFLKNIKFNGYKYVLGYFIASVLICVFFYFVNPFTNIKDEVLVSVQNWNIYICIFIPILNFIVYFIKANSNAENKRTGLEEKAQILNNDFIDKNKLIDEFIKMCASMDKRKLSIESN